MTNKTSSAAGGIGLDDVDNNFNSINDVNTILESIRNKRAQIAQLKAQTPATDLVNQSLIVSMEIGQLERELGLLNSFVEKSKDSPTADAATLKKIEEQTQKLKEFVKVKEKELKEIDDQIHNKSGAKTVDFNDPSEELDPKTQQALSYGSRTVTDAKGNTEHHAKPARRREFLITNFEGKIKSDERGEYVVASPIGEDFGTSADDQQFVKLYLSEEMRRNGTYRENFKNLKGSQMLNTYVLVSEIDDGAFEAFEVYPSMSPGQKNITVATFKGGKEASRAKMEISGDAKDAIMSHLALRMDQKISKDISTLATVKDPKKTEDILNEADALRVFKLQPKNTDMAAMYEKHGITDSDLEKFYNKTVKDKSLQELLSGKLPTPITVGDKEVTHINQDLMLTPTQQLPKEVLDQMGQNKELFMAITLNRSIQRSIADNIVAKNVGLLFEEMENLYGVEDKAGGYLLPRLSKEDRYKAFSEKRLKKLNEEHGQLSAFRGISTLSTLNVGMAGGASLFGNPGITEPDDIDACILNENGQLLSKDGTASALTPAAYFARRHEEAQEVTTTDPKAVIKRRESGKLTSVGVIVDEFDEMRLETGMPIFGDIEKFTDDKGWTAMLSAVAAFGDDTVKALIDDIEKSAEIL